MQSEEDIHLGYSGFLHHLTEKFLDQTIATDSRAWQMRKTYTMVKSNDIRSPNNQAVTYYLPKENYHTHLKGVTKLVNFSMSIYTYQIKPLWQMLMVNLKEPLIFRRILVAVYISRLISISYGHDYYANSFLLKVNIVNLKDSVSDHKGRQIWHEDKARTKETRSQFKLCWSSVSGFMSLFLQFHPIGAWRQIKRWHLLYTLSTA